MGSRGTSLRSLSKLTYEQIEDEIAANNTRIENTRSDDLRRKLTNRNTELRYEMRRRWNAALPANGR